VTMRRAMGPVLQRVEALLGKGVPTYQHEVDPDRFVNRVTATFPNGAVVETAITRGEDTDGAPMPQLSLTLRERGKTSVIHIIPGDIWTTPAAWVSVTKPKSFATGAGAEETRVTQYSSISPSRVVSETRVTQPAD
jgi:hypothetical protein